MSCQTQEAQITLAIEAVRASKNLSRFSATETLFNISYSTFSDRMNDLTSPRKTGANGYNLTILKEVVLI